ncbi:MAG: hypothetical protein MI919_25985 [Holophagales bacterium]|nr:hypothetical protein [Holophagales bacterium]
MSRFRPSPHPARAVVWLLASAFLVLVPVSAELAHGGLSPTFGGAHGGTAHRDDVHGGEGDGSVHDATGTAGGHTRCSSGWAVESEPHRAHSDLQFEAVTLTYHRAHGICAACSTLPALAASSSSAPSSDAARSIACGTGTALHLQGSPQPPSRGPPGTA